MSATSTASRRAARIFCDPCGRRRLILLLGSALGLTWFHADVNMPQAQADVYAAITGAPPDDVRLITIPYCIGVALGVCVFYAIPFPHQTTPLEVKLTEYQEDMEKAEGKPIE